jgi:hypothetical protein
LDQVKRQVLILAALNLLVLLPPVSWAVLKLCHSGDMKSDTKRKQLLLEKDNIALNREIHRVYSSVSVRGAVRWENLAVYVTRVGGRCSVGRKIILEYI